MTLWVALMDLISVMGKYLIGYIVGSIVCFLILRPIKVYREGFDDGWEAALTEEDNRPNTVVVLRKGCHKKHHPANRTGR